MQRTTAGLRAATVAASLVWAALAGCGANLRSEGDAGPPTEPVVTADIQAGIEQHVEARTREGGGYFRFTSGDKQLALKLVRVHTEYLANLGPRRHFACVDLVDTRGDVYDVDFFLAGDPGAMKVTETTLHKINGRPYYAWERKLDGTWHRVGVKNASSRLLGVVTGTDEFEFTYRATLCKIDAPARMWVPLASTDRFQTVEVISIDLPGRRRVVEEPEHGNKVLFVELGPKDSGGKINIRYRVRRHEKAAYPAAEPEAAKYLQPERLVPLDDTFRTLAEKVLAGKKGDLVRARALYDHVMDRMRYAKFGEGFGRGDAVYACDSRHGNCSDYHAYFIALARAAGIPARFAIGAAIPSERDDGGTDGYHCWVEFHAEGKWWPIDISEADKYSALATYYFGHHPANRFELSRGRDLRVEPAPASGPINFLADPVLEIAGKPVAIKAQFSFRRTAGASRRPST